MSTPQEKPKLPAVVGIVIASRARAIVEEFRAGESPRQLSRKYQLSRSGVDDLIRAYAWKRPARARR